MNDATSRQTPELIINKHLSAIQLSTEQLSNQSIIQVEDGRITDAPASHP